MINWTPRDLLIHPSNVRSQKVYSYLTAFVCAVKSIQVDSSPPIFSLFTRKKKYRWQYGREVLMCCYYSSKSWLVFLSLPPKQYDQIPVPSANSSARLSAKASTSITVLGGNWKSCDREAITNSSWLRITTPSPAFFFCSKVAPWNVDLVKWSLEESTDSHAVSEEVKPGLSWN